RRLLALRAEIDAIIAELARSAEQGPPLHRARRRHLPTVQQRPATSIIDQPCRTVPVEDFASEPASLIHRIDSLSESEPETDVSSPIDTETGLLGPAADDMPVPAIEQAEPEQVVQAIEPAIEANEIPTPAAAEADELSAPAVDDEAPAATADAHPAECPETSAAAAPTAEIAATPEMMRIEQPDDAAMGAPEQDAPAQPSDGVAAAAEAAPTPAAAPISLAIEMEGDAPTLPAAAAPAEAGRVIDLAARQHKRDAALVAIARAPMRRSR